MKFFKAPILLIALLLPSLALAQANSDITLFVKSIPFLGTATDISIENYVNALYTAAISIAAILVVIKLILAGVKYMFSEVVTNKEEAKKDIQGSLFGLLLVLGAVTILNTINPNLTKLNFLEQASRNPADATGKGNMNQAGSTEGDDSISPAPPPWDLTIGEDTRALSAAKAACEAADGHFKVKNSGANTEVSCE